MRNNGPVEEGMYTYPNSIPVREVEQGRALLDDTNYASAGLVNLQCSHGLIANVVLGLFGDEVAFCVIHSTFLFMRVFIIRVEQRRIVGFFF